MRTNEIIASQKYGNRLEFWVRDYINPKVFQDRLVIINNEE